MKALLRVLIGLLMLLMFGLWGLWTFAPGKALALFHISHNGPIGINALKSDMGGAVLLIGLFVLLYFVHSSRWLVPAAIATACLLLTRIISLCVDGFHTPGLVASSIELLATFVFLAVAMFYPSNIIRDPYHEDYEVIHWLKLRLDNKPLLKLSNVFMRIAYRLIPVPSSLQMTTHSCEGWQQRRVPLELYAPKDCDEDMPCLVYFHGGGFMTYALFYHRPLVFQYAREAGCKVLFVDYALSVDQPYPAGVEDCYAAVRYAFEHADELGIDKDRIAVGGDSAGGALATAVAMMLRDRGKPQACYQMLIYPVIDDRMETASAKQFQHTPLWDTRNSKVGLQFYLEGHQGDVPGYAYPARAESLKDLPPAYVEVAEFDGLRDEGIAYAKRLETDGVTVQLVQLEGAIHAFEVVHTSKVTQAAVANRIESLRKALHEETPSSA